MRLLPSEQDSALARIPELIGRLENEGRLVISEPCDCRAGIGHDNGVVHPVIRYAFDSGRLFVQYNDSGEWEETTKAAIRDELAEKLPLGW